MLCGRVMRKLNIRQSSPLYIKKPGKTNIPIVCCSKNLKLTKECVTISKLIFFQVSKCQSGS